jgi:hypothetical protein
MEKTLSGIGHATFSLPLQAPKPWLQDVPERLAQQIETAHRYLGRASRHCQESRSWCTWATVCVHRGPPSRVRRHFVLDCCPYVGHNYVLRSNTLANYAKLKEGGAA